MKNSEKIYRELGEVNDEYIPVIEKKKGGLPLKIAAVGTAAAAVIGVFAVRNVDLGDNKLYIENTWQEYKIYSDYVYNGVDISEGNYDGLTKIPMQTMENNGVDPIVILMAYDISDLENGNPWNESMQIDSLPVFKNSPYPGTSQMGGFYYSEEQMTQMAENAAHALGVEIAESKFDYVFIKVNPSSLTAVCDGEKYGVEAVKINVYGDGSVHVDFGGRVWSEDEKYMELPEEYSFTCYDTDDREAEKTMRYLIDRFKELIQFENPVINVHREDLPFSGGKGWIDYKVYNGSDDPIQRILNYNFVWADFGCYQRENSLTSISLKNGLSAAECMGNYPVITLEEAKEILISTNVSPDINGSWYLEDGKIDDEDIKKVELIYNTGTDEFYLPYYQFYVEVKCDGDWITDKNLRSYSLYRVPAVKSEYFFEDINPDLDQSALFPFFASEISFPDGSVLRKSQAVSTPPNDNFPVLEYDFGFLRYADSYSDSADYDNTWFKVKAGDILDNGMTVKSANYLVAWYDGVQRFYSSEVELTGEVEAEGALFCYEEDNGDFKAGDLYFYPGTSVNNASVPLMAGLLYNGPDTLRIYLGNIESVYMSDYLKNLFADGEQPLKLILTLKDFKFSSSQSQDGAREERAEAEITGFRTWELSTTDIYF